MFSMFKNLISFFHQTRKQPKMTKNVELQTSTVYVQDCTSGELSNLYQLDIKTGKAELVGVIADDIYDIAFVGSQLYGLDQDVKNKTTRLVKIDSATGKATVVGDIGFYVVGLAYNRQRETLYASAAKQLIAIDLETGHGKIAIKASRGKRGCGEVAFDAEGNGYITLIGTDRKKLLASCNLETNKVKIIGDIGFPDLASMTFIGNTLYGVTGNFFDLGKDGQLIRIDTKTGRGTLVTITEPLGRWAGMTIYQPATETITETTSNQISDSVSQTVTKEAMKLLTIDTKDNCYVIDTNGMNNLQQNVANSFTFDAGIYDIKITSGRYNYSSSKTEGEPFILLWIYGEDGSTFINKNTGIETGATWTTLNGYNDKLQLEVKGKAVLCALFFDVNNTKNSGSIDLSITSPIPSFSSQRLTVDSHKNCYVLDKKYLSSLKQWDSNFIEIKPGNYRIKIREGNATYWSENQKFELEPWALLWIKAGNFVPKLTGIEVDETWCSLNGFQDEFILEVKTKTTLSGFFFDTYKEDNEGQIILEIAPISTTELAEEYAKQQDSSKSYQQVTNITSETTKVTNESKVSVGVGGSGSTSYSGGGSSSFTFRFDETQMEQMWQQMAAQIESSVTVTDEQDEKKEAYYWDNLEKWILKGYQTQAKELAMKVARIEFMMKSITQQMEASFTQNFHAWSNYFDGRLNELIENRMTTIVDEQVNIRIADRSTEIKNQVVQQLQEDIDRRIDSVVNIKIDNQATEINNQVVQQLQEEMEQRINTIVDHKIENQATEINNQVVQLLQEDIDRRIDSVVDLKITDQTPNLKNLIIQQLQADIDKRIDSVVNLKLSDQTPEITNLVNQQLQADIDKRIEAAVNLKIENQSQNIKTGVINQIQADLDRRINSIVESKTDNNVQVVETNVINNFNERIDVKLNETMIKFQDNVTSIVHNELNQNFTDSLKTTLFSDIKKQQFFIDMQSIREEVNNFYSRLGQFENQLYLRIEQGDTQLYNWTLEQLTALQGCLTDRQSLVEMFESFTSNLKDELDNAPCVQPSRFAPMSATIGQTQIAPATVQQLPGS